MKLRLIALGIGLASLPLFGLAAQAAATAPVETTTPGAPTTPAPTPPPAAATAPAPATPPASATPTPLPTPIGPAAPADTRTPAPEATAQAAPAPDRRFHIGPEIGIYFPTKNLVKSRFGDSWINIGIGFGQYEQASTGGGFSLALSLLSNTHSGNSAYLLPLGVQYKIGLNKNPKTQPYVGGEGDVVFSDIRSVTDGVKWGLRTSYGGALLGGVNFNKNANVEIQYRAFSDIAGYDFSGANILGGIRF